MNIFRRYIEYLKDNPEGYWFKRKLFGWGWTPATWQGWLIILVFVLGVVFIIKRAGGFTSDEIVFKEIIGPFVILLTLLLVITWRTGEPPKWMFGFPDKEKKEKESRE